MIDETTDTLKCRAGSHCLRWVDDALAVHEEFIGLESTTAATLVALIKNVLRSASNLNINMYRSKCYDGAGVMTGLKKRCLKYYI